VTESRLPPVPNLPRELASTQVLFRFGIRIIILTGFAAFSHIGFGKSLAALLGMTMILCAIVGTIRREVPFGRVLNHWDEALSYAALYCLINGVAASA
jgi:hypothetical protein